VKGNGLRKQSLTTVMAILVGVALWGGGTTVASESAACRLMERTQEYHRLIRKGAIRQMEKLRSAGTPKMTKEHIQYLKSLTKGLEDYQVRILAVSVQGNQAKVRQQVLGKYHRGAGEWDLNQEGEWFWIYEEGDWYRLPLRPPGWDDAQALGLALPDPAECRSR
jgi:hypothetical protein